MFLKNKNIIFKIRRSKVTDYAALKLLLAAGQSMLLIQTKVTNLYKKAGGFSCLLTHNIPFYILILHQYIITIASQFLKQQFVEVTFLN